MGIFYVAIKIPRSISINFLITQLISYMRFTIMMALTQLGLFSPQSEAQPDSEESHSRISTTNYVLVMDGLSPSPIPMAVNELTSLIKKKLPVVQCSNLLGHDEDIQNTNSMVCAVCLDCIDNIDEIRELCNCSHVFHRECLDRCMDEGFVTCPLCRIMLYPPTIRPPGYSWMHDD